MNSHMEERWRRLCGFKFVDSFASSAGSAADAEAEIFNAESAESIQSDVVLLRALCGPAFDPSLSKGASMLRLVCVLIVMAIPALLTAGDDDVRKELKALQGTWKAVALEAGGKALPKQVVPDFLFIVAADGKAIGRMGKIEYEANIRVDAKKDPKTIDNIHESGVHKGKKQFGVYKLEADKWIVCMTAPGAQESDRPKSFETKDSRNVMFTFERLKEDKKP